MKIFFSCYKYDYGKKDWGYSFEYVNFFKTLKKMKSLTKMFYYPMDFYNIYGSDKFNKKAKDIISKNNFDIAFFFLFKNEFDPVTLEYLKAQSKTKTIAWMSDDHWRFDNYSKFMANKFNWIITTDENAINKYKKLGVNNVICSQWGFNQNEYSPKKNSNMNFSISFIGQPHSDRKKYIGYLQKNKLDIYCRGQGWKNGRIKFNEMIDVFYNSKINLNFTSSSNIKNFKNFIKIFLKKKGNLYGLNTLREMFHNFRVFFQKKTYQIKGRVFEITGSGGFLLTEYADYLEKYFEINKEIVVFKNQSELLEKIKYYTQNDDLRKKIALNGQKRVLKEHKYQDRLEYIFRKIK